jgi:hypothetical protein
MNPGSSTKQLLSHKNSGHDLHRCVGCTPKQVAMMGSPNPWSIQAEAGGEQYTETFLHLHPDCGQWPPNSGNHGCSGLKAALLSFALLYKP